MNRSFYIIMIPVLLVALGYILVFRYVGIAPGYFRLVIAMTLFFGVIWWMGRKSAGKTGSRRD
jgi:ABC-type spermidine/putrescine transport system permease subunit II